MTTEDDFQSALDANPDDWQTRLVFADWLDERADERAEGYRALGRLRLRPMRMGNRNWWSARDDGPPDYNTLPRDWFKKLAGHDHTPQRWRWPWEFDESRNNRREVEDAAALAFARLPTRRRATLLAGRPGAK